MEEVEEDQLALRWRMILGQDADPEKSIPLNATEQGMDKTLSALYGQDKKGGLSGSKPYVNQWLGDIRSYFPEPIVAMMQKDAIDKIGIVPFLEHPDVLDNIVPDIQLAATLLQLKNAIPDYTKQTARIVIERMAQALKDKLQFPVTQAVKLGIQRYQRQLSKKSKHIDWHRTIRHGLKNYDPLLRQIVPEKIFGYNARQRKMKEIFILIDQSGSMSESLVYSGIIGCILHQIQTLDTHLIVFDTSVVDLTELLDDPVELLFGAQLGGGTDILQAMKYTRQQIQKPKDSIVFMVTDLYDYDADEKILQMALGMKEEGIQLIVLLSINDKAQADYNKSLATMLIAADIICMACTPEQFCDLLPGAIGRG